MKGGWWPGGRAGPVSWLWNPTSPHGCQPMRAKAERGSGPGVRGQPCGAGSAGEGGSGWPSTLWPRWPCHWVGRGLCVHSIPDPGANSRPWASHSGRRLPCARTFLSQKGASHVLISQSRKALSSVPPRAARNRPVHACFAGVGKCIGGDLGQKVKLFLSFPGINREPHSGYGRVPGPSRP